MRERSKAWSVPPDWPSYSHDAGCTPRLAGAHLEDQPATSGVDPRELQDVTEEGAGRLGVVGVDERVQSSDHAQR